MSDCCGSCPAECHCAMHVEVWGSCAERDYWLDVEDSEMETT
jgi:hypothetical protein